MLTATQTVLALAIPVGLYLGTDGAVLLRPGPHHRCVPHRLVSLVAITAASVVLVSAGAWTWRCVCWL